MPRKELQQPSFEQSLAGILSVADKKGLAHITDMPRKVARLDSLFADADLKQRIKDFADYIDIEGAKGSDPKFLMIQINTRIKKEFGFSVDHSMTEFQSTAISNARRQAMRACEDGQNRGQTREVIRNRIYKSISISAENYHRQEKGLIDD